MLVLTRKVGDVIMIGDNIKVVVMSIKGKQVRLGIEADKSTTIHREEIYQKIKKETESAFESSIELTKAAVALIPAKKGKPAIEKDVSKESDDINSPTRPKYIIRKNSAQ